MVVEGKGCSLVVEGTGSPLIVEWTRGLLVVEWTRGVLVVEMDGDLLAVRNGYERPRSSIWLGPLACLVEMDGFSFARRKDEPP